MLVVRRDEFGIVQDRVEYKIWIRIFRRREEVKGQRWVSEMMEERGKEA